MNEFARSDLHACRERPRASGSVAALLLAFAAGSALAQREYIDVPIVAEGKTQQLSPHVYLIPDENRRGVPNVGIVVGSRATLVVDPGMGLKSGEAVAREVAKIAKGGDIYIVNTHFHPEHTTGELGLPSAKIIRARAQQQELENAGLQMVGIFAQRSRELGELLKEATSFRAPAETFEREKILDLGGVRARLMWVGPGHTAGDTAIFVEGDRVLFSGDLAMKQVFPAYTSPFSSVDSWLAGLETMDKLGAVKVVGAHYGVGDRAVIAAYREFFQALRQRVAELKARGIGAEDAGRVLRTEFEARYPDWEQAVRVQQAASAVYPRLP